jgi:hypothetical protein
MALVQLSIYHTQKVESLVDVMIAASKPGWGWSEQLKEGPQAGPVSAAGYAIDTVLTIIRRRLKSTALCTSFTVTLMNHNNNGQLSHVDGCFPADVVASAVKRLEKVVQQVCHYLNTHVCNVSTRDCGWRL